MLITGANKGLGREAARRLVAEGHDVWAAARDPERGRAAAEELGALPLVLDVTEDGSVDSAAKTVAQATDGVLDVLINNAGISGGRVSAGELTAEKIHEVYDVNVFGPVRVLHAFLPLLERSEAPVVVNLSSGLGSLTYSADPDSTYSKHANQLSRSWLYCYRSECQSRDPDGHRRYRHHCADGLDWARRSNWFVREPRRTRALVDPLTPRQPEAWPTWAWQI
jgi:NAD(P)-dependent dehydrogenase (short-subunit alcohol dehydrogenase family)